MSPLRVGIVGAGPMGRLHARTVARAARDGRGCALTAIVDHHPGRAEAVCEEFGGRASRTLAGMFGEVDAVVVSVPTAAHADVATELLERDLDLLVEKPLARTRVEAEQLAGLARTRGRILQVGHVEWYNRGWREAAERAGRPTSIEVERLNPASQRGLELDVVQDLMLHDLDWVTRWVGEEVVELEAEGRCVSNDRIDLAEARLRFRSGCRATLRASRVHAERARRVCIEGDRGRAVGNLVTRRAEVPQQASSEAEDPMDLQWASFQEAVRTRKDPENDAEVGVAALRLVDRVRAAIALHAGSPDRDDDSALGG